MQASIVMFTYFNPIMRRGAERFCREIKEAGASGQAPLQHPSYTSSSSPTISTKQHKSGISWHAEAERKQGPDACLDAGRRRCNHIDARARSQRWSPSKYASAEEAQRQLWLCRPIGSRHPIGRDGASQGGIHSGRLGAGAAHHSHYAPATHGSHRQGLAGLCLPGLGHRHAPAPAATTLLLQAWVS